MGSPESDLQEARGTAARLAAALKERDTQVEELRQALAKSVLEYAQANVAAAEIARQRDYLLGVVKRAWDLSGHLSRGDPARETLREVIESLRLQPPPRSRTVRVRLPVVVGADGQWVAPEATSAMPMVQAAMGAHTMGNAPWVAIDAAATEAAVAKQSLGSIPDARLVWVEADIPIPPPRTVVQGRPQ